MPFLSPNQQCQSTDGKNITSNGLAYRLPQAHLGVFQLCLWPLTAPGNLGEGCHASHQPSDASTPDCWCEKFYMLDGLRVTQPTVSKHGTVKWSRLSKQRALKLVINISSYQPDETAQHRTWGKTARRQQQVPTAAVSRHQDFATLADCQQKQHQFNWRVEQKAIAVKRIFLINLRDTDSPLSQQAVGGWPPRYAPAQACKSWHDIRHVRIWIGHHYLCPCWTASTTNQSSLVTLTFDLLKLKVVSESRLTWATSVPVLVFLGLSVLDLSPMYATDRQTSDSIIA